MSNERRYDLGYDSTKMGNLSFPLWYYGIVERVDDPYDAGRIKVRVDGVDKKINLPNGGKNDQQNQTLGNEKSDAYLPWCEPLLPKFLNIVPKVGEMVKVAVFDYRNKQQRRQYIGPVIGQENPLDFEKSGYNSAKIQVENSAYGPPISKWAGSKQGKWGVYPNKNDIALLGRRNTDIILRNESNYDEVILRAGKIDYRNLNQPYPINLNKKNPAYITINHTFPKKVKGKQANLGLSDDRTHVNLIADRLNLISHMGSSSKGKAPIILDGSDINKQVITENSKLHPMIYGDVIWDLLEKLKSYVEAHIHKGSRLKPDSDASKTQLIQWFNDNMGTKSTKSNPDGSTYTDYENCRFLSKGVRTN